MSDSIDNSISELLSLLVARAPNLRPAIFPTGYTPVCLADLCEETTGMKAKTAKWYRSHFESDMPSAFIFHTEFDAGTNAVTITKIQEADETDALLCNLESMMALIANPGEEQRFDIAMSRFLDVSDLS